MAQLKRGNVIKVHDRTRLNMGICSLSKEGGRRRLHSIDNNPNLIGAANNINPCQGGPCKKSRKIIVPVLASVISTLVFLTIAGFVLLKFTRKWRQKGLEYLHDGCKRPIIHKDVKTANMLLNERLETKIGYFGLSKVFSDEFTHVSTALKGTFGYLDPKYCNSNNLIEKSESYSFGVVLLQLITGQPAE